jgi:hypothetical protein
MEKAGSIQENLEVEHHMHVEKAHDYYWCFLCQLDMIRKRIDNML